MKLIIDIDKEDWRDICNIHFVREDLKFEIGKAIMKGTPAEPNTDVLDKIRAEITDLAYDNEDDDNYYYAVIEALQIIDKYRKEEKI